MAADASIRSCCVLQPCRRTEGQTQGSRGQRDSQPGGPRGQVPGAYRARAALGFPPTSHSESQHPGSTHTLCLSCFSPSLPVCVSQITLFYPGVTSMTGGVCIPCPVGMAGRRPPGLEASLTSVAVPLSPLRVHRVAEQPERCFRFPVQVKPIPEHGHSGWFGR